MTLSIKQQAEALNRKYATISTSHSQSFNFSEFQTDIETIDNLMSSYTSNKLFNAVASTAQFNAKLVLLKTTLVLKKESCIHQCEKDVTALINKYNDANNKVTPLVLSEDCESLATLMGKAEFADNNFDARIKALAQNLSKSINTLKFEYDVRPIIAKYDLTIDGFDLLELEADSEIIATRMDNPEYTNVTNEFQQSMNDVSSRLTQRIQILKFENEIKPLIDEYLPLSVLEGISLEKLNNDSDFLDAFLKHPDLVQVNMALQQSIRSLSARLKQGIHILEFENNVNALIKKYETETNNNGIDLAGLQCDRETIGQLIEKAQSTLCTKEYKALMQSLDRFLTESILIRELGNNNYTFDKKNTLIEGYRRAKDDAVVNEAKSALPDTHVEGVIRRHELDCQNEKQRREKLLATIIKPQLDDLRKQAVNLKARYPQSDDANDLRDDAASDDDTASVVSSDHTCSSTLVSIVEHMSIALNTAYDDYITLKITFDQYKLRSDQAMSFGSKHEIEFNEHRGEWYSIKRLLEIILNYFMPERKSNPQQRSHRWFKPETANRFYAASAAVQNLPLNDSLQP